MKLSSRDIINLPVYTVSEKYLGKITSFELDIDTQKITSYYVKAGSLVTSLLNETSELIISEKQVVSITEEKMVVEDLDQKELIKKAQELLKKKQTSPAMTIDFN